MKNVTPGVGHVQDGYTDYLIYSSPYTSIGKSENILGLSHLKTDYLN